MTAVGVALLLLSSTMTTAWSHPLEEHAAKASSQKSRRHSRWGANYFPNIPLVTHEGIPVRFYDDLIKDKVVVINFIYTSCQDSCPLETARLVQVQRLLGERVGQDIFMYSITIDPEHDTPEVLKQYRAQYHVATGWTFLTGKRTDIDLLRKKLGLYTDDLNDSTDHNLSLIMGNEATGRWMKRSPFDNPKFIAAQIGDWLHNWKERKVIKSYAEAPQLGNRSRGEYLFQTRCTSCHTIGQGDSVGPDLAGVTTQRERAWLKRWLAEPDRMLAEGDTIALDLLAKYKNVPMPNLRLTEVDVDALIAFMEERSAALPDPLAQTPLTTR
jgi:protein SCO1/2